MTITYGTNVPAGLFLPGMIVGSALGEIMAKTLKDHTEYGRTREEEQVYINTRKHFVVLGCGAVLAGYTRMTYSLAVILMETSQSLSLFIPIIFTIYGAIRGSILSSWISPQISFIQTFINTNPSLITLFRLTY